jgi:hypothetical protein
VKSFLSFCVSQHREGWVLLIQVVITGCLFRATACPKSSSSYLNRSCGSGLNPALEYRRPPISIPYKAKSPPPYPVDHPQGNKVTLRTHAPTEPGSCKRQAWRASKARLYNSMFLEPNPSMCFGFDMSSKQPSTFYACKKKIWCVSCRWVRTKLSNDEFG